MTDYASAEAVAELVGELSDAYLLCRARGHAWKAYDARHNRRYHYYEVTERCTRCKGLRHMEQGERGQVLSSWWYEMPDGYYIQGIGYIAGEARDPLRAALIDRVYKITTLDDDDVTMPHSQSTRIALGLNGHR